VPDYAASFLVGTTVRVIDSERLREFKETWKYHHPLEQDQLAFAGRAAVVEWFAYYHGGEPLYKLVGLDGVWHEACLERS